MIECKMLLAETVYSNSLPVGVTRPQFDCIRSCTPATHGPGWSQTEPIILRPTKLTLIYFLNNLYTSQSNLQLS